MLRTCKQLRSMAGCGRPCTELDQTITKCGSGEGGTDEGYCMLCLKMLVAADHLELTLARAEIWELRAKAGGWSAQVERWTAEDAAIEMTDSLFEETLEFLRMMKKGMA